MKRRNACILIRYFALWGAYCAASGCDRISIPPPAPLFTVPLSISGEPVEPAIVDTGGGFEILLRTDYGLELIGSTEVLAFGGLRRVDLTGSFSYSIGGVESAAQFAIVGLPECDCNGVGYHFFRKTRTVLSIDFQDEQAKFLSAAPESGVRIPFARPPETLANFESSFVEIDLSGWDGERKLGGEHRVIALFDTGASLSVIRRGLLETKEDSANARRNVAITHSSLGAVAVNVGLFETPGLPDVILGTDVMRALGSQWYFTFSDNGGHITVFPTLQPGQDESDPDLSK